VTRTSTIAATLLLFGALAVPTTAYEPNPYLGAWNITGTGPDSANVYWLEITERSGALSGMFLNRTANPTALVVVRIDNGELVFQGGQPGQASGPEYRARVVSGKLYGHHTVIMGGRGAPGQPPVAPSEHIVNWVGVRPPTWPPQNANGQHTYGAPITLFAGTSIDVFDVQYPARPAGWTIESGVLTNSQPGNNLVSKLKFQDFKVEAEYKVAEHTNSGIYLRGRYELQVLDDFADSQGPPDFSHMAIYGRTPPRVKASKPPGEWQQMEAIIVGNRVTVRLNGTVVHDNVAITGITGGALDNDELSPGPLMIQGDHGQVWFRKLVVTPITAVGRQ
jgi:3-keto-disaccharide hydrolase